MGARENLRSLLLIYLLWASASFLWRTSCVQAKQLYIVFVFIFFRRFSDVMVGKYKSKETCPWDRDGGELKHTCCVYNFSTKHKSMKMDIKYICTCTYIYMYVYVNVRVLFRHVLHSIRRVFFSELSIYRNIWNKIKSVWVYKVEIK